MSELKPCPFCGRRGLEVHETVECEVCDFGTHADLWNKRTEGALIADLEKLLKKRYHGHPSGTVSRTSLGLIIDKHKRGE